MKGILFSLIVATIGCGRPFLRQKDTTISPVLAPNPAKIIIQDHEFTWNQIVDEIDNYFKIKREERVRLDDGIITEGLITTYPTSGSSLLEPWRKDSTPGFEKWYSTFHSVRRYATVRVIPNGDCYLLDVQVIKEKEDVPQPERSTAIPIRSNISTGIQEDGDNNVSGRRWYKMGRDKSLEQRIIINILERLRI